MTASARPYTGKRLFDLIVVLIVGVPAFLICAVGALVTVLVSGRPILFIQERIGRNGEPFRLIKLRTMRPGPNSVFPDATRVTGIGKVLRRSSIDEIPQLLNVLRGQMSVVGPRPTLRYQVERYDIRQRRRLAVRPGMTGLAQVTGRNLLRWPERIELDLEYVERQSLLLDLKIIALSIATILRGSGVAGHPLDDPLAQDPPV